MRHKNKLTYLQKPKRIRKSKKDFFRGDMHRTATKVSLERTMVPVPYILLLSVLATTVIGYISFNFLFSRIHIDGSMYNFMRTSLSVIHIPHILNQRISVPMPHVQIPYIPVPHLNFQFIVTPLQQLFIQYGPIVFSYFNPLPYWIQVFTTTGQCIGVSITWLFSNALHTALWTTKAVQTNGTSFLQSIHPLQLLQMAISGTAAVSMSIMQTVTTGTTSLANIFRDYISLVGNLITTAGASLLYAANIIGTVLIKMLVFCGSKLIDLTIQQIALRYQNISLVILSTLGFIDNVRTFSVQEILMMWEILLFVSEIIIHGITMLFTGIVSIVVSIFTVIVHVLTIIVSWFVSIFMAIKKSIDDTFGAIGGFIHLGDPLYQAIASSITDLFSSMGATMAIFPKLLQ